jgi:serine/threonine protein kinase
MSDDESPDPLLGTVLEGRFRLERLLGEGGMGRVYIGEELRLRRRIAVKVLLPELGDDPAYVERFLREAQAIAALQHDNVVDIYHLGEDPSGVLFFAMELLIGEDLETRIDRRGVKPYTWVDCCRWGTEVARGMAAVHHAGLVHRDLKPSNVFLARQRDGREVVKLLDFGIARAQGAGNLTGTGAALGTPNYMSPEQVLANPLDGRADVYSLGVVLFELLTRELPSHGEPIQVAMQHCHTAPPRPSQVAPEYEIPAALDEVVLRAMAKDPEQRFASMEELADALASLIPGEGASPPGPLQSVSPSGLRQRTPRSEPDPVSADDDQTRTFSLRLGGSQPRRRRIALAVLAVAVVGLVALPFVMPAAPPEPAEAPKVVLAAPPVAPPPTVVEPTVPAEPKVPVEPVTKTSKPPPIHKTREPKPGDPRKELERKAQACRRKHDLVGGPAISLDYAVRSDGSVSRASARSSGALAQCLVAAIKSTRFEARLALGQTIEL